MNTISRFFLLGACLCLLGQCANAQWLPTSGPLIQSGSSYPGRIEDLAVVRTNSGDTVIIAATRRGIFFSLDKGENWKYSDSGLTHSGKWIHRLVVVGAEILAGTNDDIFRSTNNGTSWTKVKINPVLGLTSFSIYDLLILDQDSGRSKIFAATATVGPLLSTDRGLTWVRRASGIPRHPDGYTPAWCMAAIPNDSGSYTLFAGTYRGIYRSRDDGLSWTGVNTGFPIGSMEEWSVNALGVSEDESGNAIILASTPIGLLKSANEGELWQSAYYGVGTTTRIHCFVTNYDTSNSILIGTSRGVYISSDQGKWWTEVSDGLPSPDYLKSVYALVLHGSTIYAGLGSSPSDRTIPGVWKRSLPELIASDVESPGNAQASALTLSSYPNPVTSGAAVTLNYTLESAASLTLRVQDLLGRTVSEQSIGRLSPGEHSHSIPTQSLKPGMYFYTLLPSAGKPHIGKLMVR
jgi:photosystem II stability/assembly factor-like uncharacterized protein